MTDVLSSFVFLKREVPVRLANIMKELMLMPVELRRTRACSTIVGQYAQSFQVVKQCDTDLQVDKLDRTQCVTNQVDNSLEGSGGGKLRNSVPRFQADIKKLYCFWFLLM